MTGSVVPAVKDGIFKTYAALAGEIIAFYEADNLRGAPGLLDGHHLKAFFRERIVKAYGKVALTFGEEFPEIGDDAYCAEGNAFGTPGKAPVCGEYSDNPFYFFPVVKGLSHAHENGVGKFPCLLYGKILGQDVRGAEVAMKTLPSCHAELAAHLAPGLGTHAESLAVPFRYHYGFHARVLVADFGCVMPGPDRASYREQILLCAIRGHLYIHGSRHPNFGNLFKCSPAGF